MLSYLVPGGFSDLINWNNYNSNWNKLLGFRNMQEKLENDYISYLELMLVFQERYLPVLHLSSNIDIQCEEIPLHHEILHAQKCDCIPGWKNRNIFKLIILSIWIHHSESQKRIWSISCNHQIHIQRLWSMYSSTYEWGNET